ncbi:unnamed protein product, partial [Meganyctiphanes norvegica]
CDDCSYKGQVYGNGVEFMPKSIMNSDLQNNTISLIQVVDPCVRCKCQNGNIQCYRMECPTVLCDEPVIVKSECCPTCSHTSMCVEGSNIYQLGESWMHPDDACINCTCSVNGKECHQSPCDNIPCIHGARATDGCCPICNECLFTQRIFANGAKFTHTDDPCMTCNCQNGTVSCSTVKCPDISCMYPMYVSNECCPTCPMLTDCLLEGIKISHGEVLPHPTQECQECRCNEGSITCQDVSCPQYTCSMPRKNGCCYECNGCTYGDSTYDNNTSFSDPYNPCRSCWCYDGHITCNPVTCPPVNCTNPQVKPGTCCPICLECEHEGKTHRDGEVWTAMSEPCTDCRCDHPDIICHPKVCSNLTCSHPALDQQGCCRSCWHCELEGKKYMDGQHFPDPHDPCTECVCRHGSVECEAISCMQPSCPYPAPGFCCPECEVGCLYKGQIISNGASFSDLTMPCRNCTCNNGFVSCGAQECPNVTCSHPVRDNCCSHCEGCYFKEQEFESGQTFPHPKKPCTECFCNEGNITCKPKQCPNVICQHPISVNCCPDCTGGCSYQERVFEHGQVFTRAQDPCIVCKCQHGTVECAPRQCPDLQCENISLKAGECCPRCPGNAISCMYDGHTLTQGESFTDVAACNDCICQDGEVQCIPIVCPKINCTLQIVPDKECCPVCDMICLENGVTYPAGHSFVPPDRPCEVCNCETFDYEEGRLECSPKECESPKTLNCSHPSPPAPPSCCPSCDQCYFNGRIIDNGEAFNHSCSSCICQRGNVSCSPLACSEVDCPHPQKLEGMCCPTCPSCLFQDRLLHHLYSFSHPSKPCTICICKGGEIHCSPQTCPTYECESPEFRTDECCPSCPTENNHQTFSGIEIKGTGYTFSNEINNNENNQLHFYSISTAGNDEILNSIENQNQNYNSNENSYNAVIELGVDPIHSPKINLKDETNLSGFSNYGNSDVPIDLDGRNIGVERGNEIIVDTTLSNYNSVNYNNQDVNTIPTIVKKSTKKIIHKMPSINLNTKTTDYREQFPLIYLWDDVAQKVVAQEDRNRNVPLTLTQDTQISQQRQMGSEQATSQISDPLDINSSNNMTSKKILPLIFGVSDGAQISNDLFEDMNNEIEEDDLEKKKLKLKVTVTMSQKSNNSNCSLSENSTNANMDQMENTANPSEISDGTSANDEIENSQTESLLSVDHTVESDSNLSDEQLQNISPAFRFNGNLPENSPESGSQIDFQYNENDTNTIEGYIAMDQFGIPINVPRIYSTKFIDISSERKYTNDEYADMVDENDKISKYLDHQDEIIERERSGVTSQSNNHWIPSDDCTTDTEGSFRTQPKNPCWICECKNMAWECIKKVCHELNCSSRDLIQQQHLCCPTCR